MIYISELSLLWANYVYVLLRDHLQSYLQCRHSDDNGMQNDIIRNRNIMCYKCNKNCDSSRSIQKVNRLLVFYLLSLLRNAHVSSVID